MKFGEEVQTHCAFLLPSREAAGVQQEQSAPTAAIIVFVLNVTTNPS